MTSKITEIAAEESRAARFWEDENARCAEGRGKKEMKNVQIKEMKMFVRERGDTRGDELDEKHIEREDAEIEIETKPASKPFFECREDRPAATTQDFVDAQQERWETSKLMAHIRNSKLVDRWSHGVRYSMLENLLVAEREKEDRIRIVVPESLHAVTSSEHRTTMTLQATKEKPERI